MPAEILHILPKCLWRIFNFWIDRAFHAGDQSTVKAVGIDETSKKRGYDYLMVTTDLGERRAIFYCPGKDETTISQLSDHFKL